MDLPVRQRRRPTEREVIYGAFAAKMVPDSSYFADLRNRAAYTYITGQFPSHLRKEYTGALRNFSRAYSKPSSLDGRIGNVFLDPNIVKDLSLEAHPMVREARKLIAKGYCIQHSRGFGSRNSFQNIFMFKLGSDQNVIDRITVKIDGAIKQGWD